MPFGTITVGADSYEPRKTGIYSKSTVALGDPLDEFRIRGSAGKNKNGNLTATVSRTRQKDVTIGNDTVRKNVLISLSISIPASGGFTAAEIAAMENDIHTFLTAANVTRLLQGDS